MISPANEEIMDANHEEITIESVGSLEEAAVKRKQRLQQLKQLSEIANKQHSDENVSSLPR